MANSDPFLNYYDILEVEYGATEEDIYRAYARIKKLYSLRNPDVFKNFTFDELQELLVLIEEAYSTLGNQDTREVYNQQHAVRWPQFQLEKLDFISTSNDDLVKTTAAKTNPSTAEDLIPSGFGKTTLSTYRRDDTLESMIAHQEFFDGHFLSKIRRYKNVHLDDLSKATCISMKYLTAIEDNNYKALPAAVFTRGYIHEYSKTLGLDTERVVASFMKLYNNGRK